MPRTPAIVVMAFLIACCKRDATEVIDNIQPGRRDYSWTTDTLRASGQLELISVWASSPQDIWAVGPSDDARLSRWHYDGSKWQSDSSGRSSNLFTVFGFSANDVWSSDAPGGYFWHYNGADWTLFSHLLPPGYPSVSIDRIWGDSPDNVYAVGSADSADGITKRGIVMRYDGSTWRFLSVPTVRAIFDCLRKEPYSNTCYLRAETSYPYGDSVRLYQYDLRGLTQIFASETDRRHFNVVGGRVYFTSGGQILVYLNGVFVVWRDFSSSGMIFGNPYGRSEKDLFLQSLADGQPALSHYNGTDLKILYRVPGPILDVFLLPSDVLILTHDGTYPLVVRGTLD